MSTSLKLALAAIFLFVISLLVIVRNSKDKQEYDHLSTIIQSLDKEYNGYAGRHPGDFRYMIVDRYPYPFEIYEPNLSQTDRTIDDLAPGDRIDIYFYEIDQTHEVGINRFIQFIDKDGQPYLIRNEYQQNLGYFLLVLSILVGLLSVWIWKKESASPKIFH